LLNIGRYPAKIIAAKMVYKIASDDYSNLNVSEIGKSLENAKYQNSATFIGNEPQFFTSED